MAVTRTARGTITSKTSGTTLTIAAQSLNIRDLLVVYLAYDDQTLDTVTWGSQTMTLGDSVIANGVRVRMAWCEADATASRTITATWAASLTAKAMVADSFRSSVTTAGFVWNTVQNATNTGLGTAASTAAMGAITGGTESVTVGVVGTEGPSGDTAGTWSEPNTNGQRVGTTGNPAAGNVTVSSAYRLAATAGSTPALSKTGMTSRDWGSGIRHFSWGSNVQNLSRTAADTVTSISDAVAKVMSAVRTTSDNVAGGMAYDAAVIALNPVGYYRMGDPSGTTMTAEVGPNGTYVGSPALGQTAQVAGDTAVLLNGSTQYGEAPDDAAWDFGNGPFTLTAWVKFDNAISGSYDGIIGRSSNYFFHRKPSSHGTWPSRLAFGLPGITTICASSSPITDTDWHFVAVTYNGGTTGRIYIDGVEGTSQQATTTITDTNNVVRLGRDDDGYLDGLLDEVAIFNTVLSGTDIADLYAAGTGTGGGASDSIVAEILSIVTRTVSDTVTIGADAISRIANKVRTTADTVTTSDAVAKIASMARSLVDTVAQITTYAQDDFSDTSGSGWASADTGGSWTHTAPSSEWTKPGDGTGQWTSASTNANRHATLAIAQQDVDVTARVRLNVIPTGANQESDLVVRYIDASNTVRFRLLFTTGGGLQAGIGKIVGGSGSSVVAVSSADFGSLTFAADDWVWIRGQVEGDTVRLKMWKDGSSEPGSWQQSGSLSGDLAAAGSTGVRNFNGSWTGTQPSYDYDDFVTTNLGGLADVVAAVKVLGRTVADTVTTVTESAVRVVSMAKTVTDSLTTSDSVSRIANKIRTVIDTVTTVTEAAVRIVIKARTAVDTTSVSDSIARIANKVRTLADSVTTSDSVVRISNKLRTALDTVTTVTDSLMRQAMTFARVASDTTSVTDAIARVNNKLRTVADTIVTSDTVARISNKLRTAADTVAGITDSVVGQILIGAQQLFRTASDTVAIGADSVGRTVSFVRTLADTTAVSDALTRLTTVMRSAVDAVTTSDLVTRVIQFVRATTDTTVVSDAVARTIALARTVTDATSSVSDEVIRIANKLRTAADTISVSDTVQRAWTGTREAIDTLPEIVDQVVTSATVLLLRVASDTVATATDSVARTLASARTAVDVVVTSETVGRIIGVTRTVSDTLATATDFVVRGGVLVRRTVEDSLDTISDLVTRFVSLPGYVGERIMTKTGFNRWREGGSGGSGVPGAVNKQVVRDDNNKETVR